MFITPSTHYTYIVLISITVNEAGVFINGVSDLKLVPINLLKESSCTRIGDIYLLTKSIIDVSTDTEIMGRLNSLDQTRIFRPKPGYYIYVNNKTIGGKDLDMNQLPNVMFDCKPVYPLK